MGKFFVDGQGWDGAQGCAGQTGHRNLAGDGSIDHESAKIEELGMMPKEGQRDPQGCSRRRADRKGRKT
jgi:hypothetical protein